MAWDYTQTQNLINANGVEFVDTGALYKGVILIPVMTPLWNIKISNLSILYISGYRKILTFAGKTYFPFVAEPLTSVESENIGFEKGMLVGMAIAYKED